MRHVPTLLRRELAAYFLGPMAFLILLAFQAIAWLNFWDLVDNLARNARAFSGLRDDGTTVLDAAALAGAQAVDRAALYAGGSACTELPVDPSAAQEAVLASTGDATEGLRHTFASLSVPDVHVDGSTVRVRLQGQVRVPFGRVLSVLLPNHPDGRVAVTADAAAASALSVARC